MTALDWVWFRDPNIGTTARQIAERCGWHIRRRGDRLTVCTLENFTKVPPKHLVLRPLFLAGQEHPVAVEDVTHWGHDDLYTTLISSPQIANEVSRLTASGSREGGWSAHALVCKATPPSSMPGYLRDAYAALSQPELFPDISMWSLRDSPEAAYRFQVVRSLVLAEHYPVAVESVKRGELAIEMATGLGAHRLGLPRGERLGPLLACAAPWILGFVSDRIGGSIIFVLGKLEFGRSPATPSGDLIDQLNSDVFAAVDHTTRTQPKIEREDAIASLRWWVDGLSALTSVEHDPATHRSADFYDPVRHLAMTLTIDRLVAVVQQITIADRRNSMVRKMLLFDALDIIEGLLPGHDFGHLTSHGRARSELAELEAVMPAAVQKVLMPRCRAAVDALGEVAEGFWIPTSRTPSGIEMPGLPDQKVINISAATTMALRLIRNGHHGYVSNKFHSNANDRAILTLHDGRIPDALPDLAFFHLVRMIAFADLLDPERLRTRRPTASIQGLNPPT